MGQWAAGQGIVMISQGGVACARSQTSTEGSQNLLHATGAEIEEGVGGGGGMLRKEGLSWTWQVHYLQQVEAVMSSSNR